jgi:hypothetical protein
MFVDTMAVILLLTRANGMGSFVSHFSLHMDHTFFQHTCEIYSVKNERSFSVMEKKFVKCIVNSAM